MNTQIMSYAVFSLFRQLTHPDASSTSDSFVVRKGPPDAPQQGIPSSGLGVRFTPTTRAHLGHLLWIERRVDPVLRAQALQHDVALVIHWPSLFRFALSNTEPLAHAAMRFVVLALPWLPAPLQQYVTAIRTPTPPALFADPVMNSTMLQHLEDFFGTAAGRRLCRAFTRCLDRFVDAKGTAKFARCADCLSAEQRARLEGLDVVPGQAASCDACAARTSLRHEVAVLDVTLVNKDSALLNRLPSLHSELGAAPPSGAYPLVTWLLGARFLADGATFPRGHITVDLLRLTNTMLALANTASPAARVATFGRLTGMRTTRLPDELTFLLTDNAAFLDSAERERRVAVVAMELRSMLGRYVVLPEPSPDAFERYVTVPRAALLAAEQRRAVSMETPNSVLQARLQARALKAADDAVNPARVRQRTYVSMEYVTSSATHVILIRRHGSRFRVTSPFPTAPGVGLPASIALQVYRDVPVIWWSFEDLVKYARSCDKKGHLELATALRAFCPWLLPVLANFQARPAAYRALLREELLQQRAAVISAGSPQRMGRFSETELSRLRDFMERRPRKDTPFYGPLTQAEWAALHELIPHRGKQTLLDYTRKLGFEYAKSNGYLAFLRSGFAVSKSSLQRAQWISKGVKL